MERKLFGTDGVRGRPGEFPLDDRTVFALGHALGRRLKTEHPEPQVLIGMDTRESSLPLAGLFAGGLQAGGAKAHSAGVIPTPGVAFLTQSGDFDAGVVISASHNPYYDNGIKLFGGAGFKLPDADEAELEHSALTLAEAAPAGATSLEAELDLAERYLEHVYESVGGVLPGSPRVVIDCANGAAAYLAPKLFERLGAKLECMGTEPDGRNINRDCGSLHTGSLGRRVVETGAQLGIAFDGDADRSLFVTSGGKEVNGDVILLLLARYLAERGRLPNNAVVGTVMANMGLQAALKESGILLLRTPVGDKYVLEEMLRSDVALGGEQSGHIILREHATTGDGMLTAAFTLKVLSETGQTLAQAQESLPVFPQELKNVQVQRKPPIVEVPELRDAIAETEQSLGEKGRVVVRYSGTESLLRVMVEAEDAGDVERHTERLAQLAEQHLK